mgnify:CR=1 FL=1
MGCHVGHEVRKHLLYTGTEKEVVFCVEKLGSHNLLQADDGIRVFCLSRGLGDVYRRQGYVSMYIIGAGCDQPRNSFATAGALRQIARSRA